jgi:hypothetical protein
VGFAGAMDEDVMPRIIEQTLSTAEALQAVLRGGP